MADGHHPEKAKRLRELEKRSQLRFDFLAHRNSNRAEIHACRRQHHLLHGVGDARLKVFFAVGGLARGQINLLRARVAAHEHPHAASRADDISSVSCEIL